MAAETLERVAMSDRDRLADKVKRIVDLMESVADRRAGLTEEARELDAWARALGLDAKILRAIVKARAKDPEARLNEASLLAVYGAAIGLAPGPGPEAAAEAVRAAAQAALAAHAEAERSGARKLLAKSRAAREAALAACAADAGIRPRLPAPSDNNELH